MNYDLLMGALRKRRGKNFDAKGFLTEVTEAKLGDGPDERSQKLSSKESGSTDELAPSQEESQKRAGEDKKKKKFEDEMDDLIFDEDIYKGAHGKENTSLIEKMMLGLGDKIKGRKNE